MIVGVHLDGHEIRVCGVNSDGVVAHAASHKRSSSSDASEWAGSVQALPEAVQTVLPDDLGDLYLAAPPGVYQIRRVPLEVAEEVDRRNQVTWEVQQALCAKEDEYLIGYVARGSSAVWIAIPTICVEKLTVGFADRDVALKGICAEPLAIALALRRIHPAGQVSALRATSSWITWVDLNDGTLVAASSHNTKPDDLSTDAGTSRSRRDILQRHIGETSHPPYFMGNIDESSDPEITNRSVSAVSFTNPVGYDCSDTLMTIAYGTALYGAHESTL